MCNLLSLCCQRAKWRPVIGRACDIHSIYSIYPSLHALRTILSVCPIGRVMQWKFNAARNIVYMGVNMMHCQVRSPPPLPRPAHHEHFKNKTRNSNWIHLVHNYVHFVLSNSVICFTLCELHQKTRTIITTMAQIKCGSQLKTALNCSRARLQLQFPAKWAATIENILWN